MPDQQTLLSTKATYIRAGDGANTNYGSYVQMYVRWKGDNINNASRALIEFDLAQLVPQLPAQVIQARLRLSYNGGTGINHGPDFNVACHRLTAAWVEMQATWNNRQSGTPWGTPGGDLASPPVVTIFSPKLTVWTTEYFDITQLLKDWLAGTHPNYGVLLKPEDEPPGDPTLYYVVYEADDSTQAEQYKPALVVDYDLTVPVAEEPSAIPVLIRRRRR
jgi:hypothetical protein